MPPSEINTQYLTLHAYFHLYFYNIQHCEPAVTNCYVAMLSMCDDDSNNHSTWCIMCGEH